MNDVEQVRLTVDADSNGQRLDVFLATQLPQFSRTQMRRSINGKQVLVDGQRVKASYSLSAGETVQVELPDQVAPGPLPECVPLKIIYEDQDIVAIDKPPGMVVHPARGHWTGTLASALAYHFENLSSVGGPARPGIVHRLDRDTSGVIIIAKNDAAHLNLCAQFESRTVDKCYHALVRGVPDRDADFIDAPIGAHPYQRERMAIRANHSTSREARTRYEVVERFV
ncbi:MAG: RluA family pseudouridine synthase, partial [Planctomycetales bacterium]|nr:RluA family pseudouridine synthase [Planctomycetales bacterium]